MSELLPINIDLTIASKYKKLTSEESTFLDKHAVLLVPSQYHDRLVLSLKALLNSYKLQTDHLDYFLYIIGQNYLLYQSINEQKIDAYESQQPLKFLQAYANQTEAIKSLMENKVELEVELRNRYIEVISPRVKNRIKLKNTDYVAKAIYHLFKSQYYFSLKEILQQYNDIPPLSVLTQLVQANEYIIDYATHYFIPQIILDLLDYIEHNLIGSLSLKKHAFIFDILFVWGVFTLNQSEETKHYEVTTEFEIPVIPKTEKTAYVDMVLRRYRKYLKTHPTG